MKPYIHAQNSAKKFGGSPDDYLKIHDWFDQTKAHFPDMRHRAILHSSFGIYLCEQFFGTFIKNCHKKKVQVRDIAEFHVIEDLGYIPTLQDYLTGMPFYEWLGGKPRKPQRKMTLDMKTVTDPPIPSGAVFFDTAPNPGTTPPLLPTHTMTID